jgi:hypothetical protein
MSIKNKYEYNKNMNEIINFFNFEIKENKNIVIDNIFISNTPKNIIKSGFTVKLNIKRNEEFTCFNIIDYLLNYNIKKKYLLHFAEITENYYDLSFSMSEHSYNFYLFTLNIDNFKIVIYTILNILIFYDQINNYLELLLELSNYIKYNDTTINKLNENYWYKNLGDKIKNSYEFKFVKNNFYLK